MTARLLAGWQTDHHRLRLNSVGARAAVRQCDSRLLLTETLDAAFNCICSLERRSHESTGSECRDDCCRNRSCASIAAKYERRAESGLVGRMRRPQLAAPDVFARAHLMTVPGSSPLAGDAKNAAGTLRTAPRSGGICVECAEDEMVSAASVSAPREITT